MGLSKAEVLATGRQRFVGWKAVPDGFQTKTRWAEEGMRLRKAATAAAYVFAPGGSGKSQHYELYTIEQVEPKRRIRPGKALPLTPGNLGAALFEINKAAKRRRDAAESAYRHRKHELAARRKGEKDSLYQLKDRVLQKLIARGMATFVGYHLKLDRREVREWIEDEDALAWIDDDVLDAHDEQLSAGGQWGTMLEERQTFMACYELAGFRFHRIIDSAAVDGETEITDLGEWMSKATPRPTRMVLKDAEATLRAFLAGDAA
jgi:hypothetical protein